METPRIPPPHGGPGGPDTDDSPAPGPPAWRTLRFIQQFGPGRPRTGSESPNMLLFFLYISSCFTIAVSCSSRSTPKVGRGGGGALGSGGRPNITFQTYSCPEAYARWYCLNGATCFAVKIRDSILYNCECADGYMGQRCEFKDLDGSYLPSREREIHRAGVAGGLTLVGLLPACFYLAYSLTRHFQRRRSRKKFAAFCLMEGGLSPYHLMPQPQQIPEKTLETIGGKPRPEVGVYLPWPLQLRTELLFQSREEDDRGHHPQHSCHTVTEKHTRH